MEQAANIGKKYKDFIETLIEQMKPMFPNDVNKLQEDYLINNIRKSTSLLANSMETDSTFMSLDFSSQCLYIQIMAEWSFHKEIDLFRSGIPPKYWKIVMQKIWYTMWEVMYACIQNNAPEGVVLSVIERYVNRTYKDAVEELKISNVINEEIEEKAKEQSNIEVMAFEYLKKRKYKKIKRIIYYITLFVIISCIVTFTVIFFKVYGVIGILTVMLLFNIISKENQEEE